MSGLPRACAVMLSATLMLSASALAQTTLFNGVTVPGVVITHSPASSERYIGSPSLAILPDGTYVASHDFFGPNGQVNGVGVTEIFRSTDKGQTWSLIRTINGQYWSNLFVQGNDLYILGVNKGFGNLIIRKSPDGGVLWTAPTNSTNGLLKAATSELGYHTSSVPVVVADGRIWRSFEDNGNTASTGWPGELRAGMMSAPVGSNLLDASNWTFSNMLTVNTNWLPGSGFNGWLEGNAVVDRNGDVVNVLRVDVDAGDVEKGATARVQSPSSLTFNSGDIYTMPGGAKKFTVRYSAAADKYLTVASVVTQDNYSPSLKPGQIRNIMALMSSDDLGSWDIEQVIVQDLSDVNNIGFQYMDWQFEGSEIVIVSRTAYPDGLGGADNYHNANFLTFHRISYSDLLTPGDANADGVVNLADLQILGDNWMSGGADWDLADFNGDGVVNLADLQILGDNWAAGASGDLSFDQALAQSGLPIPEPGAMLLLVSAATMSLLRPRQHPVP